MEIWNLSGKRIYVRMSELNKLASSLGMVTSFPLFQLLRSQSKSTSLKIGYTYGPSAKLSIVSRMLPVSINHY